MLQLVLEWNLHHEMILIKVWYDSETWTWWNSDEKITIILNMLKDPILSGKCEQWVLWKICGKIINIMVVISPGKFNIDQIIIGNSVFTNKCDRKEGPNEVVDFVPPDVQ